VARGEVDLETRQTRELKRPLTEHLTEWHEALLARGITSKQAGLVHGRAKRLLNDSQLKLWADLSPSKIQTVLAVKRRNGTSVQTANFYLQAVRQFTRWMIQDGRASSDPLVSLKGGNVRTDRRYERRALSTDELVWILKVTPAGPDRFGIGGIERARLYRLAVETGLRAAELRSLIWACVDLDGKPPTITLNAENSKRRREDVIPLRSSTAAALRQWADPRHRKRPLFPNLTEWTRTAAMLHADMAAARKEWLKQFRSPKERATQAKSDFLAKNDQSGHVVDFHALRHTFITNLARSGVHPKVAQQLARHSTITLTMDRYSHTVVGDQIDALEVLPDLTKVSEAAESKATGTDAGLVPGLVSSLGEKRSPIQSAVSSIDRDGRKDRNGKPSVINGQRSDYGTERPPPGSD